MRPLQYHVTLADRCLTAKSNTNKDLCERETRRQQYEKFAERKNNVETTNNLSNTKRQNTTSNIIMPAVEIPNNGNINQNFTCTCCMYNI